MENNKKSVLLIEDEPALQEAIKMKLEKNGITVYAMGTAEEGLEFLKTNKPDLVWLDVLLPGINGIDFLHLIRRSPALKDLPVVVVSASSGNEKIKHARSLNILDFIVKSEHNLINIVHKVEGFLDKIKSDLTNNSTPKIGK